MPPQTYYFWLGREGERPTYTYYGNWDLGDPICLADPEKYLGGRRTSAQIASVIRAQIKASNERRA